MKIHSLPILIFVACTGSLLLPCCMEKKPDIQTGNTLPAMDYLNSKIQSWVDSGYYEGAALCVLKNNELFFESYYGDYTDTTSLHVASAGKWVAAAVIASVVDKGLLSWDDPVKKYLPHWTDAKGKATLRQLLSHTAGYPDYQPERNPRDDYSDLKVAVEKIFPLPADTLPGSRFKYGGLAMQVAGRMAEIATGKDWETLFREGIAQPLGMDHSHFVPVSKEPGFNPMLAGGFKTCLKDYMNFLHMIANRGSFGTVQVLSAQAVEELETDQIKNATVCTPEFVELVRQSFHSDLYGLGLWREEVDETGKATLISSPGWAGVYPWVDRKNHLYGCFLAKSTDKPISEGFSPFYTIPVISLLVREALIQEAAPADVKRGRISIGKDTYLYYEEKGEGEPVVFIHGHSLNHRMWDAQFYEFARHYRAIRYDLRGYGYSSPQAEHEQFTHAEDLVKLLDALQIEKTHLIGLSLGGYIGTDMLGWFPDKILSAVLVSGHIRHVPKPSLPMDTEEIQRRNQEILAVKEKGIEAMKREWFEALMKSGGSAREAIRIPLWNMVYQWDAWQSLHKEVRVTAGDDAYELLKIHRPEIPVLVVEGRSEHNYAPDPSEILTHLPFGEFILMEDAGHMLTMEQPEKFNETVLNFLKHHRKKIREK